MIPHAPPRALLHAVRATPPVMSTHVNLRVALHVRTHAITVHARIVHAITVHVITVHVTVVHVDIPAQSPVGGDASLISFLFSFSRTALFAQLLWITLCESMNLSYEVLMCFKSGCEILQLTAV